LYHITQASAARDQQQALLNAVVGQRDRFRKRVEELEGVCT